MAVSGPCLVEYSGAGARSPEDQIAEGGELANRRLQSPFQSPPTAHQDPPHTPADGVLGQAEGDSVGVPIEDLSGCLMGELAAEEVEHAGGPQFLAHPEFGLRTAGPPLGLAGA